MPPIWKPRSKEILQSWIDTILDEASDELNDWENSFIENIGQRLIVYSQLTETQEEKLESIYVKHTS